MLTYPVSTTPPNKDATFLPSCLEEFEAGSLTADCRGPSTMVGSIILILLPSHPGPTCQLAL